MAGIENMAETTPEGAIATLERSAEQATDQVPGTPNQEIAPGGAREFLDRVLRGSRPQGSEQEPPAGQQPPSGEGGTPPEGPRPPEMGDKEWETSPERGRAVSDEIIWLETTLSYDERYKVKTGLLSTTNPEIYNEKNGTYLDQLYIDLQSYVVMICQKRGEKDPFDPHKVYEEIKEAMRTEAAGSPPREASEAERKQREADEIYLNSKTADEHKAEIAKMKKLSESDEVTPEQQEEIEEKLLIYFRAAKRKNLLQSADLILESVYQEHIIGAPREKPSDEEMPPPVQTSLLEKVKLVNEAEEAAKRASSDIYRMLSTNRKIVQDNPEIAWLKDIWDPYIARAKQRIEQYMYGFAQLKPKEGEFQAEADRRTVGRTGETYWRPSSWASYYTVSARNPEQFRIAVDTFLQMIRTGSIGKSPDDIYPHLQNFKNALGAAGGVQEQAGRIKHEDLEELRQEFEGVSYAFGADYNNEDYNPDGYYKYMMAMTKDEGPERWIRLARSRGGQVAYDLKWFDRVSKEAVSTLFHNACGSRGQIGNDTITQHFLQDQIKEILIEKSMGVMIKDYDPEDTDPYSPVKLSNSEVAEDERKEYKKKNLERIGLHIPDEEFKALYEGFDNGDAHINNYLRFGTYPEDEQKKLPESLRRSMELGQVQLLVSKLDLKTVARLKKGKPITESILNKRQQRIYKEAYDQAETSFGIAFQMVGVSCEKVRRGGGIFYIDRNIHFQAYQKKLDKELDRIRKQIKSGTPLEKLTKQDQELYKDGGVYYRKLSLKEKGSLWSQSEWLGWMINEVRDGRKLDAFSKEERDFYFGLGTIDKNGQFHNAPTATDGTVIPTVTDADRKDYVDNMPVFLAENFVQFAETWTEIKYADDEKLWDGPEFAKKHLSDISKDADIWKDPKLEKQLKGMLENTSFEDIPLKDIPNFKAMYRTAMLAKAREKAVSEIKKYGFQARLLDADYDVNGQQVGDFRSMMLKTPTLQAEGTFGPFSTQPVPVDFQTAVSHIYARRTTHTYWGYQNENRHMVLAPHIFEAAKRIRDGLSRPEDEDLLATQLLILDPTLKRIARLEGDQEQREITLLQAAVEKSNQSRQRVNRELHEAFLPKDGNPDKMRQGFNMEDWGGQSRFVIRMKDLIASQPHRFARRWGAGVAYLPTGGLSSMPAIWGQEGVLGAIAMFADPINETSKQRVVSKLGITKFVNQMRYGWMLFQSLVGSVDEEKGISAEGLLEKPTNNSDKLVVFHNEEDGIMKLPKSENDIFYAFIESFGRLDRVLKVIRTMESDTRNAQGALWLEEKDIFLPDGRFNAEIMRDINTSSSRHSERIFFDNFVNWLLDNGSGGGVMAYPSEAQYYKFLKEKYFYLDEKGKKVEDDRTWAGWIFDKIGR